MDVFKQYSQWNKALFDYFFPRGNENAILYVDENILGQIAISAKIQNNFNGSWGHELLCSTLLKSDDRGQFCQEGQYYYLNRTDEIQKAKTWDSFVEGLKTVKILKPKETPAYFAMLCAVMYIAGIEAKHDVIKQKAKEYLDEGYSGRPGQLLETLLQQLHKDIPDFDANRMVRGSQRNMSRMKYHLVLKKDSRDDFIDFLEVNNLKWEEYEPYDSFVENILVPALTKAGKTDLARFVTNQENISYVKNILKSGLKFGKKVEESSKQNTVQDKVIKWKFALEFDFDGDAIFSILCDYTNTPFNISLEDSNFKVQEDLPFEEIISMNVDFKEYQSKMFDTQYGRYALSNISNDWNILYFEKINEDYYSQVDEPQDGKGYLVFVKKGRNRKNELSGTIADYMDIGGYDIYEVNNYSLPIRKQKNTKIRTTDEYRLNQVGSWFCIHIDKGESLYWLPNKVNSESETEVDIKYSMEDGKRYFRLPPSNGNWLIGDLIVRKGNVDIIMTEQISYEFKWNGENRLYHMNGWGEVSTEEQNWLRNNTNTGKHNPEDINVSPSKGSEILLQTLFDLADEKGCVSSRQMVAALNFALTFNGIVPTVQNRKSLIYALRRLGYLIAYYDVNNREYVNQLVPKYVEITDYSIDNCSSAYLVKGVYSIDDVGTLIANCDLIRRKKSREGQTDQYEESRAWWKRPYDKVTEQYKPEYKCLPDLILVNLNRLKDWTINWPKHDSKMSDYMIDIMENMADFEKHYNICTQGDNYFGQVLKKTPCMIKDGQGHEILCTESYPSGYKIHKYYNDGNYNRPIPKHLARVYSQKKNGYPVCILRKYNSCGKSIIDYSKIDFVKGMGVPEVLDIALCVSNLGLPSTEKVFIIDQHSLGSPYSDPITDPLAERRTYSINATSKRNKDMVEAIRKLSGQQNLDIEKSDAVYFSRTIDKSNYKIELFKNYSSKKDLLLLYCHGDLEAFAIGNDVYSRENERFRKVELSDVNEALSKIIQKDTTLKLGSELTDNIPSVENGINIPIIERITIK